MKDQTTEQTAKEQNTCIMLHCRHLADMTPDGLTEKCGQLLRSGAVDAAEWMDKPVALAKVVMTAAIEDAAGIYAPPAWMKRENKELRNLRRF